MNLYSGMQAVVDHLEKFNSPPIESLDYHNARNTPTFKNAVEEMASQSATTRAMNVALPSIVVTAEFDPLRDEGEQYAKKLAAVGVLVKTQRFDGVTNELFGLAGAVSKAKDALDFAVDGLKEVFDRAEKSRAV